MCVADVYDNTKGFQGLFNIGNFSKTSSCVSSAKVHSLLGGRKRTTRKRRRVRHVKHVKKVKRSKRKINYFSKNKR